MYSGKAFMLLCSLLRIVLYIMYIYLQAGKHILKMPLAREGNHKVLARVKPCW